MIYQKELLGLTCTQIAENLNADTSTVWRAIHRFEEEETTAEKKHAEVFTLNTSLTTQLLTFKKFSIMWKLQLQQL